MKYGQGIHDIDIDAYHGQCCPGPSISSTGLRTIIARSPAHYWATSDLNPNRIKAEEKPALSLGRAAHALVLGEPEFNSKFIISPFDAFTNRLAREWRDAQTKQIVKPDDMITIHAMVDAQRSSDQVAHAFIHGQPEMSLIWQDADTGIWLKARPDWLPDDPAKELCVEYKTAANIKPRELAFDAFKFGYHLQAAQLLDGIKAVFDVDAFGVAHVCQEKSPPYLAELRIFSKEQIDFGRLQYRHALHIFADCLAKNKWPGYTAAPSYFETPFLISRLMEDPNEYATRFGVDTTDPSNLETA